MNKIDMSRLYEVIEELKKEFKNFEARKEQVQMWESVYESMKLGHKTAIHAPTGTGKSLGYIIPYIAVKIDDPKFKMTISTFTINLQEQLKRDIELGIKIYKSILNKHSMKGKNISYVVLKGQKNYFCKKRFLENSPGVVDEAKIKEIFKRLEETDVWDRQNLNVKLTHKEWETMQVDGCTRKQCPCHGQCTYFKTYSAINEQDIVITNHSLWFTRFYFVETWEEFNFFVFDEAHKLEKVILETYTFDLSMRKFENWIDQGEKLAEKYGIPQIDIDTWSQAFLFDHEGIQKARDFFRYLSSLTREQTTSIEKLRIPKQEIKDLVLALSYWQRDFYRDFLTNVVTNELKDNEQFKEEQKAWVMNLIELKEFASLSNHEKDVSMIWTEKDANDDSILKVTPNDIRLIGTPFIRGSLVTSGTLSENHSCQSFANRIKLELDKDIVLNSPFPLSEQTIVYVGKDINPKKENYEDVLEQEILDLLKVGTQKSFVLFTSNKLMWSMFKRLHKQIRGIETYKNQPLELWIQDKNNNKEVVASFKNRAVRSILFGTLSYFEGIDLKGESLTQIILTRLPYSVPNHPIQEILDSNYGYSQWEAIVRYEQSFGRLIRTGYDYGSFCILDNRVSYLNHFMEFFRTECIPITADIEEVAHFYNKQK